MEKKFFEKMAGVPAEAIDKTMEASKKITKGVKKNEAVKKAGAYWEKLGPGLTTGAADDDPSGIATYSQAGAKFGLQFIWLAPITFPLMAVVQEMCARIGLVTGRGLAANIRKYFPRWVLYLCAFLLFFANTLNIGADLGAMAKSVQLIEPSLGFNYLLIFFAFLALVMQIALPYKKYAKYLKWLALILLVYVLTAFTIPDFNWAEIWQRIIHPSMDFSKEQIFILCAIMGTTISPYLFFWQTAQEVEDQVMDGKTTLKMRQENLTKKDLDNMKIDIWSGMFLSNLVMFFIIAVSAFTLFKNGITNIETSSDAALALKPLAGDKAFLLFAFGIIGTGIIAIPVLAGSFSYALSESLNWKHGFYRKLKEASAFYGVIIISIFIGLLLNVLGINPVKALIYSAMVNGLIAPVVLILIVLISSSRAIMGKAANGVLNSFLGWLIVLVMIFVGIVTVLFLGLGTLQKYDIVNILKL